MLHLTLLLLLHIGVADIGRELIRQHRVPNGLFGKDQVHLLEGLAAGLRAHEVDKGHGRGTRQHHPQPDLPAHLVQRDAAGEDRDEAEKPLAESTSGAAGVSEFEGSDLEKFIVSVMHRDIFRGVDG